MEKNPQAWGLDIGHSSIKAVLLRRVGADVEVVSYAIEPIEIGESVDREEAVAKALQLIAHREAFAKTPVVASLSGRQIFSRTINIPVINPKKVAKMVELEARQQIPGDFSEIEWSYHLSPAADGASNDVAIFAARKELIAELVGKCKRAGINLVGVSVSSLALYNFVRYDQVFGPAETIAILDVGAENTDLVLCQGDTLWMRTLASSGNDITKALMKKFKVSFEEAEQLKRQLGDSQQSDRAFKLIEATLNELVSEVTRSLGFYKGQNKEAKLENMVISGNTFRLPNLAQYLADRLRMAIISLEDLERIKVEPGLDREHLLTDLQALGVAMGLAVQGTGVASANVNLMPTHARLQQMLKTKRWAGAAILTLVLLAIIVHHLFHSAAIAENVELASKIEEAVKDNQKFSKDALASLTEVGPLAKDLDAFALYGRHKGVNLAVQQGVLQVIGDAITEYGNVTYTPPPEVLDGDLQLQRVYLSRVEVPPYEVRARPYNALAEQRRVVIEVLIVREDLDDTKALRLSQEILDKIKAITLLLAIKDLHGGERLFSDVQLRNSIHADLNYWYKDDNFLNAQGNLAPIERDVRVKVSRAIFDCVLVSAQAKEATP